MSGSSSSSSPRATSATREPEHADAQPQVGDIVDRRYRLVALLGRGGMGTVFAAHDQKRDTRVALKLMHPHLGRVREARRRFSHEANALHRLRSDHIARHYDFRRLADGTPYLVMELVDGHDLTRDVAQRGKLTWFEAHGIIEQVCLALEVVHTAGLVHRDLKPRNVIVARRDERLHVKVVDFGLSKSHPADARPYTPITRAGMAVGSLHYMAPEQAIGSPHVDERADVFSVGCILFFLLMGEPPFSQRMLVRAGRTGASLTFASVHHRRADVPAYVDEVLRVALAPDRAHRFRTVGALRIALASDIPITPATGTHTRPSTLPAPPHPRPRVAYLVIALCALVLAATIVWLLAR